jgi:hypothetical protein
LGGIGFALKPSQLPVAVILQWLGTAHFFAMLNRADWDGGQASAGPGLGCVLGQPFKDFILKLGDHAGHSQFDFIGGMTAAVNCAADSTAAAMLPVTVSLTDFVCLSVLFHASEIFGFDVRIVVIREHWFGFHGLVFDVWFLVFFVSV